MFGFQQLLGVALATAPLTNACAQLFRTRVERWPTIEHLEVELDLHAPPRFEARGTLRLSGVSARRIPLLLNRLLEVQSAALASGESLAVLPGYRLRGTDYHSEGRVVWVDLGSDFEPREDGGEELELRLTWSGQGAGAETEQDWRGLLLLADEEFRMSDQTIFVPSVPSSADGPGKQRHTARVEVLLPADFEVFVPGEPVASRLPPPDAQGVRWHAFELRSPGLVNLVAGRKQRREQQVDGWRLVTLLGRHPQLADELIQETARACSFFSERYGAVVNRVVGICEIDCLAGQSYNWAADGLLTFDWRALGGRLPSAKIAHEVAHLWFGQLVNAQGPGERFLTEGLAEYLSWRFVEQRDGAPAGAAAARQGRDRYLAAVHASGADPPLVEVGFGTPRYSALAYSKGALCLRAIETALRREVFDERLEGYVAAHRSESATLDDFVALLADTTDRDVQRAVVPWIFEPGHLHVALDARFVPTAGAPDPSSAGGSLRGVVLVLDCPSQAPRTARDELPLVARFDGGELRARVRPGEAFELELPTKPAVIQIDPDATLPLAVGPPLLLDGARLVASEPSEGRPDAAYLRDEIRMTFDRPLAPVTDLAGLRGGLSAAASEADARPPHVRAARLEDEGRTLVLELSGPLLPDGPVLVNLEGLVTDQAGLPLFEGQLRFRTRVSDDRIAPRVLATQPAGGAAVERGLDQLRITFSEPMKTSRGFRTSLVRELERERGWVFPEQLGESSWEDGGRVLVYRLDAPLEPGTTYALALRGTHFRDLSNNPLEEHDFTWRAEP